MFKKKANKLAEKIYDQMLKHVNPKSAVGRGLGDQIVEVLPLSLPLGYLIHHPALHRSFFYRHKNPDHHFLK